MSEHEHLALTDQHIGWDTASVDVTAPTSNASTTAWWQGFAAVSCASSLGFLVVAIADTLARFEYPRAEFVFIAGLIVTFLPLALRLIASTPSRNERIGLILLAGLLCYGIKILHSPIRFTFFDEFSHWRTVIDIMRHAHLFYVNPLQQISALYPGLEVATATLASMSGLSVFQSGLLILAVARIVLSLGLYLFYEYISGSERVAGIAALLYAVNPNYLFFDAQFSYESLALPIFVMLLFVLARRQHAQGVDRIALTVQMMLGLGAMMVIHHVSTYAFVALVVIWQFVAFVRYGRYTRKGLGQAPLIAFILAVTWMAYAALLTVNYLAPQFINGVVELFKMIAGESEPRQLFQARTGTIAPLWERMLSYGTVLLILFVLPWGLWRIWKHYRDNVPMLTLGIIAIIYPATLALRFTERGSEVANRASEFIFLGIAFVLSIAVLEVWMMHYRRVRVAAFAIGATAIFVGGMLIGFARWARLPGPYLVAADTRSVEMQGIRAAQWAGDHLGSDNRIIADRINRMLMGTYGLQRTVTGYGDQIDIWIPYFSPQLTRNVRQVFAEGNIRYVVADLRLTASLPTASGYFERGERYYQYRTTPMQISVLKKFDQDQTISRVFDSGDIRMYDVEVAKDE